MNVIISDDGLQHYALQRDIEIVLFDGRGAGNGWLLPAGPLREPVSRRRDFTVVNTPLLTPQLAASVGGAPFRMQLAGTVAEQMMARGERIAAGAPGRQAHRRRRRHRQPGPLFRHAARRRAWSSPNCRCRTITISSTSRSRGSTPTSS